MFSTLSALLLILQLTSSGGIIAHELEQPWFRIGVALPFYYGTNGFKTIFFGAGQVPCTWHCHHCGKVLGALTNGGFEFFINIE